MKRLLNKIGLRRSDGISVLVALCGVMVFVAGNRFIWHIRHDWAVISEGERMHEFLLNVSFFVPILIVYGMAGFLLLLRHRMAYVFCGMASFLILLRVWGLFLGVYDVWDGRQQFMQGGVYLMILVASWMFLLSAKTRKLFNSEVKSQGAK